MYTALANQGHSCLGSLGTVQTRVDGRKKTGGPRTPPCSNSWFTGSEIATESLPLMNPGTPARPAGKREGCLGRCREHPSLHNKQVSSKVKWLQTALSTKKEISTVLGERLTGRPCLDRETQDGLFLERTFKSNRRMIMELTLWRVRGRAFQVKGAASSVWSRKKYGVSQELPLDGQWPEIRLERLSRGWCMF